MTSLNILTQEFKINENTVIGITGKPLLKHLQGIKAEYESVYSDSMRLDRNQISTLIEPIIKLIRKVE